MTYSSFYCVADQCFECISSQAVSPLNKVEGFRVFECSSRASRFTIHVNSSTLTLPTEAKALHAFSFEYIHAEFSRIPEGYLFTMRSERSEVLFIMYIYPEQGKVYCNWELNQDYTLLRFGLWMCFSIFILPDHRVAIHASAIVFKNKTVLFLGESGTGKSTHTALWKTHIPNCRLLNDDSPILWSEQDCAGEIVSYAYGAPWSGKTPCYKNEKKTIAAIVRLKQAPENRMRKLSKLEAFGALFPSAPPAFAHDSTLTDGVCSILSNLIRSVPCYQLECLPDAAAAHLACSTIFGPFEPTVESVFEPTSEPVSEKPAEGKRIYGNEIFFEQTKQLLSEGQSVRVSPLGNSMLPFLTGGKDQVEITPVQQCPYRRFSIVFAQHQQKYVIHRIIGKQMNPLTGEPCLVLLGDGNSTPEKVPAKAIYGVVTTLFRQDGRALCPEGFPLRSAAMLWYILRPIRRYLLSWITSRRLPRYLRPWKRES